MLVKASAVTLATVLDPGSAKEWAVPLVRKLVSTSAMVLAVILVTGVVKSW